MTHKVNFGQDRPRVEEDFFILFSMNWHYFREIPKWFSPDQYGSLCGPFTQNAQHSQSGYRRNLIKDINMYKNQP